VKSWRYEKVRAHYLRFFCFLATERPFFQKMINSDLDASELRELCEEISVLRCQLCSQLCYDLEAFSVHAKEKHGPALKDRQRLGKLQNSGQELEEITEAFICSPCHLIMNSKVVCINHMETVHGVKPSEFSIDIDTQEITQLAAQSVSVHKSR